MPPKGQQFDKDAIKIGFAREPLTRETATISETWQELALWQGRRTAATVDSGVWTEGGARTEVGRHKHDTSKTGESRPQFPSCKFSETEVARMENGQVQQVHVRQRTAHRLEGQNSPGFPRLTSSIEVQVSSTTSLLREGRICKTPASQLHQDTKSHLALPGQVCQPPWVADPVSHGDWCNPLRLRCSVLS